MNVPNKTKLFFAIAATTLTLSVGNTYADDSTSTTSTEPAPVCDTCTNTYNAAYYLQQLLKITTLAFFGYLPELGNSMAAFTAIPQTENGAYNKELTMLTTIEKNFQGSSEEGETLKDNYKSIFNNYLLGGSNDATSFDPKYASISSLYLNPSESGYYDATQDQYAQKYIQLLSGVAMSDMRVPDSQSTSNKSGKDKKKTRGKVSQFYTYSAMQSAIADNLAYVYALNTGQTMDGGSLEHYDGNTISANGLLQYIRLNKIESQQWYKDLGNMSIGGDIREIVILLAGCFLELSRIEQTLRRILVTESTSTSLSLMLSQSIAGKMTNTGDTASSIKF